MANIHRIFILNKEVHEKLKKIAKKNGMSTNALCRKVIKQYIEEMGW